MRPKLILIDGLPGAGKSTAAENLSRALVQEGWPVRVWLETDPLHPLHVFRLDPMGAATAALPSWMSPDEFADASLEKWQALVEDPAPPTISIVESYPFQSAVRVLLQHGISEATIRQYWRDCLEVLEQVDSALVYFQEPDARASFLRTCRARGPEWTDYVLNAIKDSPMFQRPDLPPIEAVAAGIAHYSRLADNLVQTWPYAKLVLPAVTDDYELRSTQVLAFVRRFLRREPSS